MPQQKTTKETYAVCTLCAGRGVEQSYGTSTGTATCRGCGGTGQKLVRTVVTTREVFDSQQVEDDHGD